MSKKITLAALACCLVFSGCTKKNPDPVKDPELCGYQVDYEFKFDGNATKYVDVYVKYTAGDGKTMEEAVPTSPWKKSVKYPLTQKAASAVFTMKRNSTPIANDVDFNCREDCEFYELYDDGTSKLSSDRRAHGSGEKRSTGIDYTKIDEYVSAFKYTISVDF